MFVPLTPMDRPPLGMGLPKVTAVFCMVDGGKAYTARNRSEAKLVNAEIVAVMRNALRQIPGGYFVRQQDGDLKYILTFSFPEAALLWCIAVQECLLYVDWPLSALRHWNTERSDEGQLLFMGPRCVWG